MIVDIVLELIYCGYKLVDARDDRRYQRNAGILHLDGYIVEGLQSRIDEVFERAGEIFCCTYT